MTARDDGQESDTAIKTIGFVLPGMRERAALLDGTVTARSAPGHGATVVATFPVQSPRAEVRHIQESSGTPAELTANAAWRTPSSTASNQRYGGV